MAAIGAKPSGRLRILRPSFTRVDRRGTLHEVLNAGIWRSILSGHMKARAVLGNHYHKRTRVLFFLTSGRAEVICVDSRTGDRHRATLNTCEGIVLGAWAAHAIRFTEPSSFILLKSLRYDRRHPDTFSHRVL